MRRHSLLAVLIVVAAASAGGGYAFASPTSGAGHRGAVASSDPCTGVYCVPQPVRPQASGRSVPHTRAVQDDGTRRCTEVYCIPQPVPAGAA